MKLPQLAVGDQQREGVLMPGPLMDEMTFQKADFGDELIQVVERCLPKPLVVSVGSVGCQAAGVTQRHPLVPVIYTFGLGPSGAR
ncbi:hypothetical protein A3216_07735 [Mycobacterium leprae 7935681]|nr:hypothetical protein A3216_07735 [Mycobacterium leprae 7935681]